MTFPVMLLSIKELEVRKLPFAESYAPGDIDFSGSGATQTAALVTEGVAEMLANTGAEIRIQGKVRTELEAECDRCLGRALFPIDAAFDLFYSPASSVDADADEVAIDAGEAEIGFYDLPGLVLEDILREQVLLQLPMQKVCGDACKGICPLCGANRNETVCACEAHPGDDRWSALKEIKLT